jgi:hypothetical protein
MGNYRLRGIGKLVSRAHNTKMVEEALIIAALADRVAILLRLKGVGHDWRPAVVSLEEHIVPIIDELRQLFGISLPPPFQIPVTIS